MPYCRNCGHEVRGGIKACPECVKNRVIIVPQDQRIPTEDVGKSIRAVLLGLLVVVGALAASCGGGSGKMLDIADIGWTENTAIAGLTKILLE